MKFTEKVSWVCQCGRRNSVVLALGESAASCADCFQRKSFPVNWYGTQRRSDSRNVETQPRGKTVVKRPIVSNRSPDDVMRKESEDVKKNGSKTRKDTAVPIPASSFIGPVALIGCTPYHPSRLGRSLSENGIGICGLDCKTEIVILGRDGWSTSEIDEIIESASGRFLRFYSQEMLVEILRGQPDPFEFRSVRQRKLSLEPFRVGHPGLEYVSQGWAGWVETDLDTRILHSGNAKDSEIDRVASSPIHKLGYRVGKHGLDKSARQMILSSAFTGAIPFVKSDSYMKGWGGPRAGQRLRRMAQFLASNINNSAKRANSASYQEAIEDWREDLEWLKRTYYNGVHRFDWPTAKTDSMNP